MSLIDLFQYEEEKDHSFNSKKYSKDILDLSNSKISKTKFAEHYHYICKICFSIPIIKFIKRNKIKFTCKCKYSPRELLIKDIFDILSYSDEIEIDTIKLKCSSHLGEKYIYYCEECKKDICIKCLNNCIKHENRIKPLAFDRNTIIKSKYIIDKINEKNKTIFEDDINSIELEEDDFVPNRKIQLKKYIQENSENEDNENDHFNEGHYNIIESSNIKNEVNEKELINIFKENNNDEINEEVYYSLNLFSIIIDDYQNYPNYNHIETISNIEKYANLCFSDYNEIILQYEFNEENVKNNFIELLGEVFVNNNKENCFLIINEKIFELSRYIHLSYIFDNSIDKINWPINLEVKLIKPKNKEVDNLSYMFYGINTILPSSDFSELETSNVTNMSYMFYNCSSLTRLPDISKFNTINVTDMSYMFYNCRSLTQLPDISKFNTINVSNMSYIFSYCIKLRILPDISKWNMENITNLSNMFYFCKSLTSFPDISSWNLSEHKLKNINYLFGNCKSLSSLPILSKWKIDKNLFNSSLFAGCRLLNEKYKEKVNINDKIYNCFNIFFDKIFSCLKLCYFIYVFFVAFCFLFFVYFPLYTSFNLVEAGLSTRNPLEFFQLKNNTNITYIANYYNITNLSLINETFQNEENFINYKINFTFINNGIEFESDLKKYKILNSILGIFSTLNIILLCSIFFDENLGLINNSKYVFYISIILCLSYIISIILSLLTFRIIYRLFKSFSHFYSLIENLFLIEIPQKIWNEVKFLDKSSLFLCINFIFSILFLTYTIGVCKTNFVYKSKSTNHLLEHLIKGV